MAISNLSLVFLSNRRGRAFFEVGNLTGADPYVKINQYLEGFYKKSIACSRQCAGALNLRFEI
jgi:hypothetical protein